MMKRKRLPAELLGPFAAFEDVLSKLEPAKEALTEVVPTTRLPGTPLPDAVQTFEQGLREAAELMPAWRTPRTQEVWAACKDGLETSLERARKLREEAPELGGFEGLLWAVDQLMAPLEGFHAAAELFRSLRTRG
jgi:hypothetical protein